MKRYAWVTAVCLAVLMVSGCGNQTGQETKQNSTSVSESAASGEVKAETKSDDAVSDGDAVKEVDDAFVDDAAAGNEKSASAVKLEEGEIYRDDFDCDGKEEEFSFTFEGDGKDNRNLEQYAYTMQMKCDSLVSEKELYGGYEETWMIRNAQGNHYLYQESYSDNAMYSVTIFDVTSDEIVEIGDVEGRIGDDEIQDVNAFQWVDRIYMLGTYDGYRMVGIGADGLPEIKEDAYTIGWLAGPLVVKEGMTLTVETFDINGNAESIVLTDGSELTPKKTDGTTYVDAELSDGTLCRINMETAEGFPHTIDGVDEYEYFESIPYAG